MAGNASVVQPRQKTFFEQAPCCTQGVRKTGYTDFSLLSLSCSDYLALPAVGIKLHNRLSKERISLSLPSQRVDRCCHPGPQATVVALVSSNLGR